MSDPGASFDSKLDVLWGLSLWTPQLARSELHSLARKLDVCIRALLWTLAVKPKPSCQALAPKPEPHLPQTLDLHPLNPTTLDLHPLNSPKPRPPTPTPPHHPTSLGFSDRPKPYWGKNIFRSYVIRNMFTYTLYIYMQVLHSTEYVYLP